MRRLALFCWWPTSERGLTPRRQHGCRRRADSPHAALARPRSHLYFFACTSSLNALHSSGAVSGPTLFTSPYCAFFRP